MLVLEKITKIYKNKNSETVCALKDFSYSFKEQGLYLIMGKSGSGKTTLAKIISLYDTQNSGTIRFKNVNYSNLKNSEKEFFRINNVCLITQEENVIDYLTVYENVEICFQSMHLKVSKKDIFLLLDLFKLKHLFYKKTNQISGGEKQRLSILRKIVLPYKIIILDEPTSFLDEENKKIVIDFLNKISLNKLVIVITHEYIENFCQVEDIIELQNGEIVKQKEMEKKQTSNIEFFTTEIKKNKFIFLTNFKFIFKKIKNDKINFLFSSLLVLFACCIMYIFFAFQFIDKDQQKYAYLFRNDKIIEIDLNKFNYTDALNFNKTTNIKNILPFELGSNDNIVPLINGIEMDKEKFAYYNNQLFMGKFPTKIDEIMISKKTADEIIAKSLTSLTPIKTYNEIILLEVETKMDKNVKIVGIFENSKMSFFESYFYVVNNFFEQHYIASNIFYPNFKSTLEYYNNETKTHTKISNEKFIFYQENLNNIFWKENHEHNLTENEIIISIEDIWIPQFKQDLNKQVKEQISLFAENEFLTKQEEIRAFLGKPYAYAEDYCEYILDNEINEFDKIHSYDFFKKEAYSLLFANKYQYLFSEVRIYNHQNNEVNKKYEIVGFNVGGKEKILLENELKDLLTREYVAYSEYREIIFEINNFDEYKELLEIISKNEKLKLKSTEVNKLENFDKDFVKSIKSRSLFLGIAFIGFIIIQSWCIVIYQFSKKHRYRAYFILGYTKKRIFRLSLFEKTLQVLLAFLIFLIILPGIINFTNKNILAYQNAVFISFSILSVFLTLIMVYIFYLILEILLILRVKVKI